MDNYFDIVESQIPVFLHPDAINSLGNPYTNLGLSPSLLHPDSTLSRAFKHQVSLLTPSRSLGIPGIEPTVPVEQVKRLTLSYFILNDAALKSAWHRGGRQGLKKEIENLSKDISDLKRREINFFKKIPKFGSLISPFFGTTPFIDPLTGSYAFSGMKESFDFDANSTPKEGRWRLRDPKKVINYWRKASRTKGVSYIMGTDIQTGRSVVQAVRFDKSLFDKARASAWWKKNKDRSHLEKLWRN